MSVESCMNYIDYWQIMSNNTEMYMPNDVKNVKYSQMMLNNDDYRQIMSHIVKHCQILPNTVEYCQTLSNIVKHYRI